MFHHHQCSIHNDAEIECAQAEEVGRNPGEVHAHERKQQRKRYRDRSQNGCTHAAQKQEQHGNHHHQTFEERVRYGVHGVRYKVGSVIDRTNVNPGRKAAGIDIVHRLMDALQHLGGIFAAAHQHDALYAGCIADPEDTGRLGRADLHLAHVADEHRHTLVLRHDDVFDIVRALDQADAADHHRLLAIVQHGAARVLIVRAHGLRDLSDGEVVFIDRREIEFYLVLLHQPPEGCDVRDTRHLAEARLDNPVLIFAKLDIAIAITLD